ncbi:MAG TPA: response regulator [Tepidisphaeraceae bacterium]|nr:response regulator [Tepidisphaeraceae bacterium]
MRLLVAEDHPNVSRALAQGLREQGYAVDVTADGTEAEHLIAANDYDCVILDMMLPGKDGWAILRDIRRRGIHTPVLCLTARDAVEDRVRGLDQGADDYLVKPFAWEELVARVRRLVHRRHGLSRATICVGDLELDTAARTVRRAGRLINLTAKEYQLLHYLAVRADQVVPRSDIWEHLYDQDDQSTSNAVDVYIAQLRKKIDRDFEPKLIHTRRGMGYMLSATAASCRPGAEDPMS